MDLLAALLIQALMSLAAFGPVLIAPLILVSLGLPPHWVGAYPPIAFAASIVSSGLSGRLIQRFGPWRVSFMCMALMGSGTAVFAAATPIALALSTIIIGLSYGPTAAAGSSILVQSGTRNLSLRMSVRQAGVPLGTSLGAFVLPHLCQTYGWAAVWVSMGALFVAIAVLAVCTTPMTRAEGQRSGTRADVPPMRLLRYWRDHRKLRPVASLFLIFAAAQTCFSSFLSTFLVDFLHLGLRQAGILVGIGSALGMGARVAWGLVADRLGTLNVLAGIGATICLSAVLTGSLTPGMHFTWVAAAIALFGSAATGWNGVLFARAVHLAPPGQVGGVTGEMSLFAYIGFVIAAPLFSTVVRQTDIGVAYVVTGITCGVATAAFTFASMRTGRNETNS